MRPHIEAFFDPATYTYSYVVIDPGSKRCAIIDSVLDYDPKSGRTRTDSADKVIAFVKEKNLQVAWILETHAHADHLTAAPYLKAAIDGRTAIGDHITTVQAVFKGIFNLEAAFSTDGRQFDYLMKEDELFTIGALEGRVMYVPGHTPACVAYQIGDAVVVGDTMFMPDVGTARCDFPGGDAATLYHSIQRLYLLPDETRVFVCHDYGPGGREPRCETTIGEQKHKNIHVRVGVDEAAFVKMRTERDATLSMPVLILPAVQVNMRAGELPEPESNGVRYLKLPIDSL